MSQHQKQLNKKQKLILYVSCAIAAIITAVIAVILLIHTVENPPSIVFGSSNSSNSSYLSSINFGSSDIFIPKADITVNLEGSDKKVDKVIEAVNQVEPTKQNQVIVKKETLDTTKLTKRQIKLDVKYLPQAPELPTGCEITSLTTVLNYYGYNVSKTKMCDEYLEKTIDTVGNFWEIFVGDPRSNGFGCYANPIVKAANRYLATKNYKHRAVNYSGTKFEDLLTVVESGTPVIIWSTMYGEKEKDLREPFTTVKWTIDGTELQWIAPEHCMVLIGYDLDRNVAIMSDPQRGIVEYSLETVKSRYLAMHSQCIVLESGPVINGIENGATYYTTQYVTVTCENIASVTVNGEAYETSFFIDGNKPATYEIKVTDTSDNVVTYTIYTKDIKSLIAPLEDFGAYTVTADNLATINDVQNTLLNLSTKYSSSKESAEIDDMLIVCDNLLKKISSIEIEIKDIEQRYNTYVNETSNTKNISEIISLLENINKLLSGKNLTVSQRSQLQIMASQCDKIVNNAPSLEATTSTIE